MDNPSRPVKSFSVSACKECPFMVGQWVKNRDRHDWWCSLNSLVGLDMAPGKSLRLPENDPRFGETGYNLHVIPKWCMLHKSDLRLTTNTEENSPSLFD